MDDTANALGAARPDWAALERATVTVVAVAPCRPRSEAQRRASCSGAHAGPARPSMEQAIASSAARADLAECGKLMSIVEPNVGSHVVLQISDQPIPSWCPSFPTSKPATSTASSRREATINDASSSAPCQTSQRWPHTLPSCRAVSWTRWLDLPISHPIPVRAPVLPGHRASCESFQRNAHHPNPQGRLSRLIMTP